jgi:hypothetical protein
MNLNHFYHYYKSKSGGVSNLLLGSEELGSTGVGRWNQDLMNAVNANVSGVANPLNSDETVDQLDFQASKSAKIRQDVTLVAGTEYTFSVWARAASGTQPFRLRYYDNVGGSGGASAFTASATWSPTTGRYSFTFTAANSGTFTMMIQNAADAVSRRIYFWGAMLNVGATAADYIKTTFTGPSSPATPLMEFGDNFAGVTAYYSLRRFTIGEDTNAIRVRRSSDDTEQDIGFDSNGDLDSTALTTFVNAEYTLADEDFSSSTGWTLGSGISITEGVLRANTSGSNIWAYKSFGDTGVQQVRVTFTISNYVSGNVKYINFGAVTLGTKREANGTYTETITLQEGGNSNHGFIYDSSFVGDIDNFEIVQITADGAVTTWYDQTGNGNDATNSTESEQPLVVSGGTLVEENSKAAINANGTNVLQTATGAIGSVSALSVFSVLKYNVTGANNDMAYAITSSGYGAADDYFFFRQLSGNFEGKLNDATQLSSINLSTADTSQYLFSHIFVGGSKHELVKNGASTSDTTNIPSTLNLSQELEIFSALGTILPSDMKFQELIVFNSDQSSNRTGIESNINDHFDIYTP